MKKQAIIFVLYKLESVYVYVIL